MSVSWSSSKQERLEDQVTAAFLTTLRLCPKFARKILKEEAKFTIDEISAKYEFQPRSYDVSSSETCVADGKIWDSKHKIFIENKIDAALYRNQIEKYVGLIKKEDALAWFIYAKYPSELRQFKGKKIFATCWSKIHLNLVQFIENNSKSTERAILEEFGNFLEVNDLGSFTGLDIKGVDAWKEHAHTVDQLEKYLLEYSQKVNEKDWDFKSSEKPSKEAVSRQLYLSIFKSKKNMWWSKYCVLYVGFLNGIDIDEQWPNEPHAYVYAKITSDKMNRISNKNKIGLSVSGFYEERTRGKVKWHGFFKTLPLSKIARRSVSRQKDELNHFFDGAIRVLEKNMFHPVEIYHRR